MAAPIISWAIVPRRFRRGQSIIGARSRAGLLSAQDPPQRGKCPNSGHLQISCALHTCLDTSGIRVMVIKACAQTLNERRVRPPRSACPRPADLRRVLLMLRIRTHTSAVMAHATKTEIVRPWLPQCAHTSSHRPRVNTGLLGRAGKIHCWFRGNWQAPTDASVGRSHQPHRGYGGLHPQ